MDKRIYPVLVLMLVVASYFHMQAIVLGLAGIVIVMSLREHFEVAKAIKLFTVLLVPVLLGLFEGFGNSNYLIAKDFYYFTMPVLLILCGIALAGSMNVGAFLKVLVIAGAITSVIVTCISVAYGGVTALVDPYSAHYAIGIVGTPGPPIALACLLFTRKFDIRLFTTKLYWLLLFINVFGLYMFASRSYFIIALCFMFLLIADKIKKVWILPAVLLIVLFFIFLPSGLFQKTSTDTFMGKTLGSFSEITIGDYNSDEDINLRYRGYETFMALNGYLAGSTGELLFGGLGKLIDLKTFVRLGEDVDYRYIPVLHNGWLYLLVKTGIVGVLTYLSIFISLIVVSWKKYADKRCKPAIRMFAALGIGSMLSLLLTNYIVTAFFNVEMSIILITLGYSYFNFNMLVERMKQREKIKEAENNYINDLTYSL